MTFFSLYVTRNIWLKIQIKPIDTNNTLSEIFFFSYPLAFTAFITWAFQSFDRIALKQWSSVYQLGIYVAAFRIVLVLQMVQTSFTTYWIPLAYERFLTNANDIGNKQFFSKANSIIAAIMLICGVGLIMCKDLVVFILEKNLMQLFR